MATKSGGKLGAPKGQKFRSQRRKLAKNLLKGMNQTEALIKAGYSKETANKASKAVIQHPQVQSILTDAIERVLAEEKAQFDDIVRPYVKALKANIVVKNSQTLMAEETKVPDHAVRMEAATHIAKLYQPKNVEEDENPENNGPPVLYQINFIEEGAKAPAPVVVSPASTQQVPNGSTGPAPPIPQVAFVRGKR